MAEGKTRSELEKVEIQFKDQDNFGVFCVQLRNDNVPFGMLGFHTLEIYQTNFEYMPDASRRMYVEYLADEKIISSAGVQGLTPGSRRQMLTVGEAEELARRNSF